MKTILNKTAGVAVFCILVAASFGFTYDKKATTKKVEINCVSSQQNVLDYLSAHGYTVYSLSLANGTNCDRIADVQYADHVYVSVDAEANVINAHMLPQGDPGS